MKVTIQVHVETTWQGASTTEEVEVDLEGCSTEEEVEAACEEAAREAFFEFCNYGWSKKP